MTDDRFGHHPVLLDAVVDVLVRRPDAEPVVAGRFLDGTVGGGGHAEAVLEASGPGAILVGIDRDPEALAAASERLARFGDAVRLVRGAMADMAALAGDRGPFDGILLDLGVSSWQLDQARRGFSFLRDGPLDMRMDPDQELDAAAFLDSVDLDTLTRVLREYGEEPRARRIARAILDGRPWRSTAALAACVARASGYRGGRTHPATRTFQAIRMAVNDELGQLDRALRAALDLLRPGGRLAVLTFHSIEDRRVKRFFREAAAIGTPRDAYGHPVEPPRVRLVLRRPLSGAALEPDHPRSRSARLRAVERLSPRPGSRPRHPRPTEAEADAAAARSSTGAASDLPAGAAVEGRTPPNRPLELS